jgi:hypothetical protein
VIILRKSNYFKHYISHYDNIRVQLYNDIVKTTIVRIHKLTINDLKQGYEMNSCFKRIIVGSLSTLAFLLQQYQDVETQSNSKRCIHQLIQLVFR